ncbi:hypothetical protein Glove_186g36 [Diversispora epigaea]|uniref:Uncharacterized protein n=1 Tax=Diversispora epigaea TaxID=1348612 RepID=A0A397IVQ0_9GLOM|nr:hypothetical protein Glove_186g36 [Diversispora epigaea]
MIYSVVQKFDNQFKTEYTRSFLLFLLFRKPVTYSKPMSETKKVHKYFERTPSKWNITDFMDECALEPFDRIIEFYISSLEIINDTKDGKARDKAQLLLNRYRKGNRPDYKVARKWKESKERDLASGPSVTITGSTVQVGSVVGVNKGTFDTKLITSEELEGESSTNKSKKRKPARSDDNLTETDDSECFPSDDLDFSGSDRDEKELDKRKQSELDDESDYETSNSPTSSDSNNQQKKRKINKGKQPKSKIRMKRDNRSASSLNSISNNVKISQDSSNQEKIPTVIVTNPTTRITRTPSPRPNIDNANIQITPQKSVLFKDSVTYLQNHIKMNVNNQGMIIKDNHAPHQEIFYVGGYCNNFVFKGY